MTSWSCSRTATIKDRSIYIAESNERVLRKTTVSRLAELDNMYRTIGRNRSIS